MPLEIGSLAGFQRLRSVILDSRTLFGIAEEADDPVPCQGYCEMLPRTIERFVVIDHCNNNPCHDRHLRELLEAKEKRFPGLRNVEMTGLGQYLGNAEQMRRDFDAKGIKLLLCLGSDNQLREFWE